MENKQICLCVHVSVWVSKDVLSCKCLANLKARVEVKP